MDNKSALEKFYDANTEYTNYYQNLIQELQSEIMKNNPELAALVENFNNELQGKQDEADEVFLRLTKAIQEVEKLSNELQVKSDELNTLKESLIKMPKYEILDEVEDVLFAQIDEILRDPAHPYHAVYLQEIELNNQE